MIESTPLKTKKIKIFGFSSAAREVDLSRKRLKLEKAGWVFVKKEDSTGPLSFLSSSTAEFYFSSTATRWQKIEAGFDEKKSKIFLSTFIGLVSLLIYSCVSGTQQRAEESAAQRTIEANIFANRDVQKKKDAAQIATSLLNLFRNSGFKEDVVIDVGVDPLTSEIVVVMSNSWVALSRHERKQMRQVIQISIKKIKPPDGWNFYLTDFLGNRL